MTVANEVQKRIEEYLDTLRARLRGVKKQNAREFIEELRGHIQDRISAAGEMTPAAVEKVLAALGDPNELANEFRTNALPDETEEHTKSPIRILSILFRWASFNFTGLFMLVGALAAYLVGGLLLIGATLKPFNPHTVGLWAFHDETGDLNLSLRLGTADPPAGAHELLGWWIVPIGLLAAVGLVFTTSRLTRWSARKIKRSNVFA